MGDFLHGYDQISNRIVEFNMRSFLSALLFIAFASACNNNHRPVEAMSKVSDLTISEDTILKSGQGAFSYSSIKIFGDSIVNYFRSKAGYNISEFSTTIDTVFNEQYTKLVITIRTDTYKTKGLISYDIYTFKKVSDASYFFHDLKTQELVSDFGINKRPNHIVLDSNKVYWHHLEHPYGHRLKDLTGIFNRMFNFKPSSFNLDSVSGFTYCRCKNEDADISGITGKWKIDDGILMLNDYYERIHFMDDCVEFLKSSNELFIEKNQLKIGGKNLPFRVMSSIQLPNNSLFWKHYFADEEDINFKAAFLSELKKIRASEEPLTVFDLQISPHCTLKIVQLEKGKAFLLAQNKFYKLTKVK